MLEYYENKYSKKKKTIVKASLSGAYRLKEIATYFAKHYSVISRVVKANE